MKNKDRQSDQPKNKFFIVNEPYHRKPHDGEYVSWTDTKMGGPYGVLDGEDLKKVKGRQKNNQR